MESRDIQTEFVCPIGKDDGNRCNSRILVITFFSWDDFGSTVTPNLNNGLIFWTFFVVDWGLNFCLIFEVEATILTSFSFVFGILFASEFCRELDGEHSSSEDSKKALADFRFLLELELNIDSSSASDSESEVRGFSSSLRRSCVFLLFNSSLTKDAKSFSAGRLFDILKLD